LIAALLLLLAVLQQWRPQLFSPSPSRTLAPGAYHVTRVIDGDTFVLAESRQHVRLIGADTPETVKPNWPVEPWGPAATAFTKKFLSGGEVRLEFDTQRRDKYDRILAYVWVGNRLLNEELIRAGLARAEPQYRYSAAMKGRFRRAQTEARAAHRGMWSKQKKTADNPD
jgi:micrococcal nuclease